MSEAIKLSICIPTVPARGAQLAKLMDRLAPQVDEQQGQVEILLFFNNFEYSMGFLRQSMLDDARGEYICMIDDDDMVPEDYCATILPLLDGVDYIGFKVNFIDSGIKKGPVIHSLKYPRWFQDDTGYYRNITHLNPLRTALARQFSYPLEYNVGEDEVWSQKVAAKTEHFIDREMYTYQHDHATSVAYQSHHPVDTPQRPVFKSKNVRFHPRSTKNATSH